MLPQGLLPDVITYCAVISACEKATLPQRALEIVEAMLHQGLLPKVITYSALISACGTGTQPPSAMQLSEAMLHQGLLRDVITYNALVMPARRVRCRREPLNSWRLCCTKASRQT